jgi:sulfoxide reductase heme-binding subunit YedZ
VALSPLVVLVWDFTQGRLGANPIQVIQLRTGNYALILLMLSLACTPVNILFGWKEVLRWRRPLGLYAFLYASLHLLNFIGLDYGFNPGFIREGFIEKPYALVGFAALLCLLPLAITSTKGWMRRLGKNWGRLHWLVYLAAVLALIHFTLQFKADIREALVYWVLAFLLLVIRLPAIRKAVHHLRDK